MPLFKFKFKCDNCHNIEERFFKVSPATIVCSVCSEISVRINSIIPKTRGGVSRTIYSRSMGVHPDQIPEMEKNHPGRKYAPDGRLEINGFQHQKKMAKEHNFVID